MIVTPQLGKTAYTLPSDREIAVARIFNAPQNLVFDVWTNPRHLPRWMTGPPGWTMTICEIDLKPGGLWKLAWKGEDGTEMTMTGEYREVVPPERVVSSERWGPEWPETINTVTFSEVDGQTTLSLTILYPSKEARDAALQTGMKEGMDMSFARMTEYVASLA